MNRTGPRLDDYDYELPADRIAQTPAARRAESRLLRWRADGHFEHRRFREVESLLRTGDLLVLNDTRVFPARLLGRKRGSGGRVEVLLLGPLEDPGWEAMVRPGRRLPPGTVVELGDDSSLEVAERREDGRRRVEFEEGTDVWRLCEEQGEVPLPPYIDRAATEEDRARYQTVFARERGSVAAPTAGLHFDAALLERLRGEGVRIAELTLHVGPGTFQPLDEERLRRGSLHGEWVTVGQGTLEALRRQRADGGRIVAVGTTVCRALESLPAEIPGADFHTCTRLLIQPGHRFRHLDVLLTNFHLPRSSLLLLVAAFAGPRWREAYRVALEEGYRFYSYGDANWIEPSR